MSAAMSLTSSRALSRDAATFFSAVGNLGAQCGIKLGPFRFDFGVQRVAVFRGDGMGLGLASASAAS